MLASSTLFRESEFLQYFKDRNEATLFVNSLKQIKSDFPDLSVTSDKFQAKVKNLGCSISHFHLKHSRVSILYEKTRKLRSFYEKVLRDYINFSFNLSKVIMDKINQIKSKEEKLKQRFLLDQRCRDISEDLKLQKKKKLIADKIKKDILKVKAEELKKERERFLFLEQERRNKIRDELIEYKMKKSKEMIDKRTKLKQNKELLLLNRKKQIAINKPKVLERNLNLKQKLIEEKRKEEKKQKLNNIKRENLLRNLKRTVPYFNRVQCISKDFNRLRSKTFSSAAVSSAETLSRNLYLKDDSLYKDLLLRLRELSLHDTSYAKVI